MSAQMLLARLGRTEPQEQHNTDREQQETMDGGHAGLGVATTAT